MIFYEIVGLRFLAAWYAKRRREARRRCRVQQYSSGIGHLVKSKMRALHAVGRENLHIRWSYSILDLAHLAVSKLFPTSAGWDALAPSNSPAFNVLQVNSERVVAPSRHG